MSLTDGFPADFASTDADDLATYGRDWTKVYAPAMTVVDNATFYFQFAGLLGSSVGFVEVPYQDMQVQNFQGGFVKPGGQWFRKPT